MLSYLQLQWKKWLRSLWFTIINIWKLNKLNSYQKWEKIWDKYQIYDSHSLSSGTSRTHCKHAPCPIQWGTCALQIIGNIQHCHQWSTRVLICVQPWVQDHTRLKSPVCTPAMTNSPNKIPRTIKTFLHGSRL